MKQKRKRKIGLDYRKAAANSWLGSKCGFGGDAKFCTFIAALSWCDRKVFHLSAPAPSRGTLASIL